MKKIIICLALIFIFINVSIINLAVENEEQDNVYLGVSKSEIKSGEEFSFTINLANINVVAFDLNIHFDENLFEYVSGPENTNVINGRIITSWYDDTGGNNPKQNCELVKYTLKAKEFGNELISIQGEFYNVEGGLIQSFTDGIEIVLAEDKQKEKIEISERSKVSDDNSKLDVMRFNQEGITPVFSPEITEYYFLTDSLNSLEVTAIPQNSKSEVNITGNTNFKEGLNTINIEVISPDKTSKTEYKIFLTKTNNLEYANANLETLAIENVTLEPEFSNDVYQYNATVSNTTNDLNILAIPEKQNASVQITGGKNLEYGNNEIIINVIAENGYTKKEYNVVVYKRNEEEQKIADEEKQINVEKLSAILASQDGNGQTEQQDNIKNRIIEELKNNKWWLIVVFAIVIIIAISVIYKKKKINM